MFSIMFPFLGCFSKETIVFILFLVAKETNASQTIEGKPITTLGKTMSKEAHSEETWTE
jgi:hypothetical protein